MLRSIVSAMVLPHAVRPAVRACTFSLALASFVFVGACAATDGTSATRASSESSTTAESNAAPGAVASAGSGAATASALPTASDEPLASDRAVVMVAGLACPKCASNVDVQLERIAGVDVENIDMKHGWVFVRFDREPRPSPARLGRAVEDAGLTYLGVAEGGAAPILPAPMARTGG